MNDQAPELLPGEIDECGWVIELGESEPSHPAYWIGPSENPAYWPFGMFSDDNLKAVRFARKEDAEAVVKFTVDASHNDPRATFRIAEHSWYCPPNTRPPSEREAWRPIETAPKDGTHILACRIPIGIRVTVNTHPPTVVHWFDDPDEPGFYTSVNERAPEHPYNPTHWQPLDALPSPFAALTAERPEAAVAWPTRERIGRLIDPQAFETILPASNYGALRKADAILALFQRAIQHEEPGRETMTSVPGDDGGL